LSELGNGPNTKGKKGKRKAQRVEVGLGKYGEGWGGKKKNSTGKPKLKNPQLRNHVFQSNHSAHAKTPQEENRRRQGGGVDH